MTRQLWWVPCSLALLLSACFSEGDEIHAWIADQKAQSRPKVTPLVEPKKFLPQEYEGATATDPFNIQKLTQALKRDSASPGNMAIIAPEMARRKEALEMMPLDSMAMVGSLQKNNEPVALVRVDNLLYQVRTGNHLGQNYGRVLKITETEVQLREVVQDSSGDWIERPASLQLQERGK
ncbi:pilus assembly protein PilP [Curvibacter sp. RS43]|jgi:type IV pilus assembly protein PilP|uniref:Pilus assembly protein PilP n=1 Tax=Curvibacter microcysteis TaxID=3026419 RepID=A0ABT5MI67_9BURK|nr:MULTISPECIES: pilus assembly protein PilP [unclassified Curvibacter]MDD0810325.1 pilus assembly protein PilP [Curvibacter sp. RS43]MDD0816279.1 pilus assembly protein PilP [Curvibacter sp. HBC28]